MGGRVYKARYGIMTASTGTHATRWEVTLPIRRKAGEEIRTLDINLGIAFSYPPKTARNALNPRLFITFAGVLPTIANSGVSKRIMAVEVGFLWTSRETRGFFCAAEGRINGLFRRLPSPR